MKFTALFCAVGCLIVCQKAVLAFYPPALSQGYQIFRDSYTTVLRKSLFDEEEPLDDKQPASRKFTGQDFSSSGPTRAASEGGKAPTSPRDQMRQREDNLVSMATSPSAFLIQAASVLVLLVLIIYVGATGQIGLNNNYEDDYYNYDPDTVVVPENLIPESKESVWL